MCVILDIEHGDHKCKKCFELFKESYMECEHRFAIILSIDRNCLCLLSCSYAGGNPSFYALMRTFIWQLTIIHLQSAMRQSCSNQTLVFAHYLRIYCWRLCYRLNMHPSSTYSCHTHARTHIVLVLDVMLVSEICSSHLISHVPCQPASSIHSLSNLLL